MTKDQQHTEQEKTWKTCKKLCSIRSDSAVFYYTKLENGIQDQSIGLDKNWYGVSDLACLVCTVQIKVVSLWCCTILFEESDWNGKPKWLQAIVSLKKFKLKSLGAQAQWGKLPVGLEILNCYFTCFNFGIVNRPKTNPNSDTTGTQFIQSFVSNLTWIKPCWSGDKVQVWVQGSGWLTCRWCHRSLASASGKTTPCHIPTYTGISRDNQNCDLSLDIPV